MNFSIDTLHDWLQTIAILVGGGWLLFRWAEEKRRRAIQEAPALFGQIDIEQIALDSNRCVVMITSNWVNTSPSPIYIDAEQTQIALYALPDSVPDGPLPKNLRRFESWAPLAPRKRFTLEPSSTNQIRTFVTLPAATSFFARIKLIPDGESNSYPWTREFIFETQGNSPSAT